MKTILYLLFFFSCPVLELHAQENLVPNSGFEIKTQCGSRIGNIVTSWSYAQGSDPYYFNECSTVDFSVPRTFPGIDYQQAKSGKAFSGIRLYASFPYSRDYLTASLNDSLRKGEHYIVEFYIALSTYGMQATDRIGMYISSAPATKTALDGYIYTPQVENPAGVVLKDSMNWTKVSGSYVAEGGEKYITIGNFYNDDLTTHIKILPLATEDIALYYIDDISVKKYTAPPEINMPSSFTPNGDGKNDFFKPDETSIITSGTMIIYNRWGSVIYKTEDMAKGWDGIADKKECPGGVYYYVIKYTGISGEAKELTGTISLMR